jgi:hypothetical protein
MICETGETDETGEDVVVTAPFWSYRRLNGQLNLDSVPLKAGIPQLNKSNSSPVSLVSPVSPIFPCLCKSGTSKAA